MKRYAIEWVNEWCTENGWTDPIEECHNFWAFPPGAVMPEPIPVQVLQAIKAKKGLTNEERFCCFGAIAITIISCITTCYSSSPMPMVLSFVLCALIVAQFDEQTNKSSKSSAV
jgi:hypothetical protein